MFRLVSKRGFAALLLALLCLCASALAASVENQYGVTLERIRVREKASLSAEIVDNIRQDSCVYLLEEKKSGSTTFVRLRYRTLEGKLATGWAALKSGSEVYIQALEDGEAMSRFSVQQGRLPSAPAGTMDSRERAERAGESGKETAAEPEKKEQKVSASVKEAQEGLLALGLYSGEVTGHAGEKTVAAIRAFQASKGLRETGEADSATLKAIRTARASGKSTAHAKASSSASSSGTLTLDSSGSAVRTLQKNLTALGYYYGDITGHYGEMTAAAVRKYQKDAGLDVTGRADRTTQRKIASAAAREKSGVARSASGRYYNLDWFKAKESGVFPKIGFGAGKTATLKDIETGRSLQVRIQSSGSHLDVEPVDEKDTKTLCQIYGVSDPKKIGARRRPMLLTTVHGYRIVCSCYGTPHGNKMVYGNKYPGQLCLHFLNAKTHGTGVVDSEHQAAIRRAIASVGKSRVVTLDDPDDLN